MLRLAVTIDGMVQGVGFRPFVHAAATARGLSGWVRNGPAGVDLEVEGPAAAVRDFVALLRAAPAQARIERLALRRLPATGDTGFRIAESAAGPAGAAALAPDRAVCAACIADLERPEERRHGYPFTSCAACGPRYAIALALPFDRSRTTMQQFPLCAACDREYRDPTDRRFHAQATACPACGPALRLHAPDGTELETGAAALQQAAAALRAGQIVALKGLGGYQLLVDAGSPAAVERLRRRKHREAKPLAVMVGSLAQLDGTCVLAPAEERLLRSPEAPIVLLGRQTAAAGRDAGPHGATGTAPPPGDRAASARDAPPPGADQGPAGPAELPAGPGAAPGQPAPDASRIAESVAPGVPRLGVLLPYTPLHRLLLAAVDRPLVCTSGNRADEPICTTEAEALARLGDIADLFLDHDRPIARPIDDSLARIGPAGVELLRRARGFAPLPLAIPRRGCALALGGQLKNTVALAQDGQVTVSPHIGDLGAAASALRCEAQARELLDWLAGSPQLVICDRHPDYVSTQLAERLARQLAVPLVQVQHHHAHVVACMAEHGLSGPVLGLAWDGAGLGDDGSLWGGEALRADELHYRRLAHLRPFWLPGGERALREPRRAALGLLHELGLAHEPAHAGALLPGGADRRDAALLEMLARRIACVRTTSLGRLFDAVAALLGLRQRAQFEGQAAMQLEAVAGAEEAPPYPFPLRPGQPAVADWEPLLRAVLRDRERGAPLPHIAARFHAALAELAHALATRAGLPRVVLGGGCFQNLRLARAVRARLEASGFAVFAAQRYPTNDGGLSLGQVVVGLARQESGHVSGYPR